MMKDNGFTLIELMVVVATVAVLAAITYSSYKRNIVTNAEEQAKTQLMNIAIQAKKWRAKSLSYKGFDPAVLNTKKYDLIIRDADITTRPLLTAANATGIRWVALAKPSSNSFKGDKYLLFSDGIRCKVTYTTPLTVNDTCTGKEDWD